MPVQTRSMKAKSSNDEQHHFQSSLDNSIQTRLQKKNSIFEPRPKILKMRNKQQPRCDSMVSAFIQETEESEILIKINKVLISVCSFLSFIVMYAMIFHAIELNCAQLNITRDSLQLIYSAVWFILLLIGFNLEWHKIYLPMFE